MSKILHLQNYNLNSESTVPWLQITFVKSNSPGLNSAVLFFFFSVDENLFLQIICTKNIDLQSSFPRVQSLRIQYKNKVWKPVDPLSYAFSMSLINLKFCTRRFLWITMITNLISKFGNSTKTRGKRIFYLNFESLPRLVNYNILGRIFHDRKCDVNAVSEYFLWILTCHTGVKFYPGGNKLEKKYMNHQLFLLASFFILKVAITG